MKIEKVLVVDDEPLMLHFLKEAMERKKFVTEIANCGKEALHYLKTTSYDLVLTDLKMPDMSGLDLLKKIKEMHPHTIVILMTAFGTVENAVSAMREGAFHYILKPFSFDALEVLIEKAAEHLQLKNENTFLKEQTHKKHADFIVGSPSMQKILKDVLKIAKSNASVLVHGESGTGKELIASYIHNHSLRKDHPYIRVNCAAIPDTLVESEFFGHEKGSFTGAHTKKLGRFEMADKGTLFLDEVTEIPMNLQPKLLRAIQEMEFERVGGTKAIHVDVRLISSSNRDLKKAIQEKVFREDLFYRLNVIPIYLPPLRERLEDILPLAHYFLTRFSKDNRKKQKTITQESEKKLLSYPWPGNIRELANVLERACVIDESSQLDPTHLYLD